MTQGYVTVHVLDMTRGRPGGGMRIELAHLSADGARDRLKTVETNDSGRTDDPLISSGELEPGTYELTLHVAEYFARHGVPNGDPPYFDVVPVRVTLGDPEAHYHVPIAVSPWGYTTFRGGG